MKKFPFLILFIVLANFCFGQDAPATLYHPNADAKKEIKEALVQSKKGGKHVILQIGGNWCKWCLEFNRFLHADSQLDSMVSTNFVYYHLNYSKENKNEDLLAKYGFPQRFGFPVFVVLDADGNYLHTESSVYLEEGKSYSKEKIFAFLKLWNPAALSPETYKKK
ncbi:MAG: thioredoxin family protein [bacterium]|nr:thioredoxin family protein [bacterium]